MTYNARARVSKHFVHGEVVRSQLASRLGIENLPDSEQWYNAVILAKNILEPIREHFGIPFSPSSWFRCEELEKILCEKSFRKWCRRHKRIAHFKGSWDKYFRAKSHPRGEACDIEIPGIPNDELYEWIKDNLEYDQLIREFPKQGEPMSGWVHVSYRDAGNRKEHFTIG